MYIGIRLPNSKCCHCAMSKGRMEKEPFCLSLFFATTAATTMVKNVPRSTAKRACQTLNQKIDFVQERFWKFMVKEFWGTYITCREIHRNILGAFLPFTFFATTGATAMVKNIPRSFAKRACQTLNQEINFVQEHFSKSMVKEFWRIYGTCKKFYGNI